MTKSFLNEILIESPEKKVDKSFSNFLYGSNKTKTLRESFDNKALVNELSLFIESDNTVSEQVPVIKRNLVKHFKKAEYNTQLAERAWMRVVSEAAKRYAEEYGKEPRLWEKMFPLNVRQAIVEELESDFYNDLKKGKIDMEELFNE